MLNLECQTVYDIIRRIAEVDDVYKVVEADEIIAKLPQGLSLSKIQLSAIIRELKTESISPSSILHRTSIVCS